MATTTQTPPKQQAPPIASQDQRQNSALTRVLQSNLCLEMAERYKVAPDQLFGVLMRTVFPKDRDGKITATVEQFVAFLAVAQQYDLNPFTREIYAFPSKGGGVIPIVPVDGWVKIVQRHKAFDGGPALAGIRFVDQFETDGQGKKTSMFAITCIIKRRDMDETEITEYMHECERDTEPWKKWPARMLRHKALIQCARVAFGLSGIYDQDEAERIIEVEQATGRAAGPEILMPQRAKGVHEEKVTHVSVGADETAAVVRDMDTTEKSHQQTEEPKGAAEPEVQVASSTPIQSEPAAKAEQGLFSDESGKAEAPASRPEPKQRLVVPKDLQISEGMKKKIFAVLNSAKIHDEKQLYAHVWSEYGLEHVHEIPRSVLNEVLAWAGGDKLRIK